MRVFVLSSSFPRSPTDIAGRFVWEWCEVLREAGHEVRVYSWGWGSAWQPQGIEVRRISYLPRGTAHLFELGGAPDALEREPWRLLEGPLAAGALLVAALGRDLPDLWVGHWFVPGGALARVCGDLTGRPSLVVGHSAGIHMLERLPSVAYELVRRYIARAGMTTVPSVALAAKFGGAVDVLPMGFEPPAGPPPSNRSDVLCFGRQVSVKGFDLVAAAVASLDVPLRVHFAGDGPQHERLRRQCTQLGVDAEFHGWVNADGKRRIFPRCRFAMFPSRVLPNGRHEGRPVSVLEVASMGVVPLLSDWPGARELAADPALQLVPANAGPEAWTDALRRLLDLPDDKLVELRAAVIARALEDTWDTLSERWLDLVERVAATRK